MALKKLTGESLDFSYNYILASLTTFFEMLIRCKNPSAKLIFFEDGIGNYVSDFVSSEPIRSILFLKIFGKKVPSFVPSELFLFQPELLDENTSVVEKIGRIPFDEQRFKKILFYVLGEAESGKKGYRLYFLQTPYKDFGSKKSNLSIRKVDSAILDLLDTYREKCVVRIHPRHKETISTKLKLDENNKMWELKCAEEINDDSVLLSYYSTGQFTPKILYGAEPWIIFYYRLVYQDNRSMVGKLDAFIEKFKKLYSHPEKIIILERINELEEILIKLNLNP